MSWNFEKVINDDNNNDNDDDDNVDDDDDDDDKVDKGDVGNALNERHNFFWTDG